MRRKGRRLELNFRYVRLYLWGFSEACMPAPRTQLHLYSSIISKKQTAMINHIRTGDERERLVSASPVMTKSWGPSWGKKLPGEGPREADET